MKLQREGRLAHVSRKEEELVMDKYPEILDNLVKMSCDLGMPDKDYAILGDGYSSAPVDDKIYCVKASGALMENIQPDY